MFFGMARFGLWRADKCFLLRTAGRLSRMSHVACSVASLDGQIKIANGGSLFLQWGLRSMAVTIGSTEKRPGRLNLHYLARITWPTETSEKSHSNARTISKPAWKSNDAEQLSCNAQHQIRASVNKVWNIVANSLQIKTTSEPELGNREIYPHLAQGCFSLIGVSSHWGKLTTDCFGFLRD